METTPYVKRLLKAAWPDLYLSQVAALLSCSYGTAYRCLEEAGCFPPARSGPATRKDTDLLKKDPEFIQLLTKHSITARRYFNCIGCDIASLISSDPEEALHPNMRKDFPTLYDLEPIYYHQKPIRLDLAFGMTKNGARCCYCKTYYGIYGSGKSDRAALYRAQLSFKHLSHKGRLELFLEQGLAAALQWEPMKRVEVKFKPELKLEPEPPPPSVESMRQELSRLKNDFDAIPSGRADSGKRKQQLYDQIYFLYYEIMRIEDPKRFRLDCMVRDLTKQVETSRTALHAANGNFERFKQLEVKDIELKKNLAAAQKELKEYLALQTNIRR